MRIVGIDRASDPRVDDFRDLTDADARPDRRGIVIAEGVNVVERLAGSPCRTRAVLGVPARLQALAARLPGWDVPAYAVEKWTLSEIVGFRVTRGVLASAERPEVRHADELVRDAARIAVLEGLNDFENLGALFRNAAAFGVDAVLLDARCADPLYRRSVRVSMGHALRVPFAVLPDPWPESLRAVRAAGLRLLAATPDSSAPALREVAVPARWAAMFGAEGPGLTRGALDMADERVRIPMSGDVDSLNVATAAAVLFAHLAP